MCLAKRRIKRNYMSLSIEKRLCVQVFVGVPRFFQYRPALVSQAAWQKGGTVAPPCDFQCGLAGKPEFKGIPP